ncbi:hypothetical protein M430DRAFT_36477 [Amorphotheca resinae ATCC 22711]|uniref:Uncharacterized protein n=1 Tax=Amorphotheca resinae ATCC 22711 TaxID=857342 RepID=A0A2T3AUF5_AMORE|nr:hypothetical protein M430DRAFT_36477 [Amorphotheca resinae ATCC 22711]PSS12310.1 hypothetical protein M430DRAFT_36477 [Amorphotheca resinae ATCC 22711]
MHPPTLLLPTLLLLLSHPSLAQHPTSTPIPPFTFETPPAAQTLEDSPTAKNALSYCTTTETLTEILVWEFSTVTVLSSQVSSSSRSMTSTTTTRAEGGTLGLGSGSGAVRNAGFGWGLLLGAWGAWGVV